jgi:hypothetical protein
MADPQSHQVALEDVLTGLLIGLVANHISTLAR